MRKNFVGKNFLGKLHSIREHIQFIKIIKNQVKISDDKLEDIFTIFNKTYKQSY